MGLVTLLCGSLDNQAHHFAGQAGFACFWRQSNAELALIAIDAAVAADCDDTAV